jgi:hypothetical protein
MTTERKAKRSTVGPKRNGPGCGSGPISIRGEPAAAPARSLLASLGRLANRDPAARSRLVPRPSRRALLLVPGLASRPSLQAVLTLGRSGCLVK